MKSPKYQIYKDKSGKFRFRLLFSNIYVIFISDVYNIKVVC